jgi:hypothetical protein
MKWVLFSLLGLGAGAVVALVAGHKAIEKAVKGSEGISKATHDAMTKPAAPGGPPNVAGPNDNVPSLPGEGGPYTAAEIVARADVRYTDPVPPGCMTQAKAMLKKYNAIVVRMLETSRVGGPCPDNTGSLYSQFSTRWFVAYDDTAKMVGCEIACSLDYPVTL